MSDEDILAALVEDLERVESQHQPGLVSNSCRYHVRCPEVVNQDHHGCRFHEECEANDPVGQVPTRHMDGWESLRERVVVEGALPMGAWPLLSRCSQCSR
eukprot:TRINITY_DN13056_c0_g1_i9.p2 TRINITY_DN13056_c0_g1~~TRINITY_DN13056_c0_g1_i9.p2  ORF type:complete len:100 (+),score=9.71 TRINITY_DN13056_c0_g1_i9:436-735(+)